jgi:hypothetical protein
MNVFRSAENSPATFSSRVGGLMVFPLIIRLSTINDQHFIPTALKLVRYPLNLNLET